MTEPRAFVVCRECGAWKEVGTDLASYFGDYAMRFWIENHAVRCPVTGRPPRSEYVSENDPDYKPLPPEKMWKPESVPEYRLPQHPKYTRCLDGLSLRLAGFWTDRDFGGSNPDNLIFLHGGTGFIGYADCDPDEAVRFAWRLDGNEQLCFGGPKGTKKDEAAEYFGCDCIYFELLTYTNTYGDEQDVLCCYPQGVSEDPLEFVKTKHSTEEYGLLLKRDRRR